MQFTRRDMIALACAFSAETALPGKALARSAPQGKPSGAAIDPMSFVNPEFRARLRQMEAQVGPMPNFNPSTLPSVRKMNAQFAQPVLPLPTITEKMVPGIAGSPEVRIYLAGATPGASKPAVLHIHGGGYVAGSAASSQRDIQQLVLTHDCVAVSVEYRLAPETPFPGSLNDLYAALKWLHANARNLGVDPDRIAVKGESAGGGQAAALAIAARDRGEIPLCFQVLIYPMLDDRTGSSHQLPPHLGHYVWTSASNRFGWSSLLGVAAGSTSVPKGSVPARVTDLSGLPPAFIGVGSIDLFAPEDIDYAQRLVLAGVATELQVIPGAFHAFDVIVSEAPLSRAFTHSWNEALRRAFIKANPS